MRDKVLKKFVVFLLAILLGWTSPVLFSSARESIQDNTTYTDALYRQGSCAIDGAWTATSVSMIGWGVGLAAGIGILAAVLHQSKASNAHNGSNAHCD
jgi:hypothetical protein